MRSYKYLKVSGERRTKIIQLQNIRFFKGKREVSHTDPNMSSSSTVSITFVLQKKDENFGTVTHYHSKNPSICIVITWAKIVQRIRQYPNSTDSTIINTYRDKNGTTHLLSGQLLLKQVRLAAATIDHESLGFHPKKNGLHSARSGAAMAMYLSGVPVYTIMLLWRWSSDAFLHYIRKQVK
jgi:hypothetical protein